MIIQQIDPVRMFTAFFIQLIVAGILLIIAVLLLKRNRNRLSLTASGFYITLSASFVITPFYLLILTNPTVYIIYFITIYLIFFSPIFLLTFFMILLKSKFEFGEKKQLLIYLGYGILLFCILIFVPKMTIDESTNWRPVWGAPLFIVMVIFMMFITIVCCNYLIKILHSFKKADLRKKWILFLLGFSLFIFILFGFLVYCVWYNLLFRTIWSFVSMVMIIGAVLMYYTFKQSAQKQE